MFTKVINGRFLSLCTFLLVGAITCLEQTALARPLSIADVLKTVSIDSVDISPDGETLAISVQRPVSKQEVFGRNAYEIDTSRNDVWLLSTGRQSTRNLTDGLDRSAGYWCPRWSPSGDHLAILSTAPEAGEPVGGDNVRMYFWSKDSDELTRASNRALVTQTRYGSPINELDIRGAGHRQPLSCRSNDENAPFVWVDNERLLVVLMPDGENSAMVERYRRFHRFNYEVGEEIRAGSTATVSRSGELGNSLDQRPEPRFAELAIFNVVDSTVSIVGKIPAFPLFGALSVALSPDKKSVAILAPEHAIPLSERAPELSFALDWAVQKRLAILSLQDEASISWLELPDAASLPVDFISWAPDSEKFLFRAQASPGSSLTRIWSADVQTEELHSVSGELIVGNQIPTRQDGFPSAFWADKDRVLLLASNPDTGSKKAAYLVSVASGEWTPVRRDLSEYKFAERSETAELWGFKNESALRFNPNGGDFLKVDQFPASNTCTGDSLLNRSWNGDTERVSLRFPTETDTTEFFLARGNEIMDYNCNGIVWQDKSPTGTRLFFGSWNGTVETTQIYERNGHLSEIDWGHRSIESYIDGTGNEQKMALMFPPDYDSDRRYPVLFWVYAGYSPHSEENYFFDRYMPGIHNLALYAAQGYIVAIPSISLDHSKPRIDRFKQIANGTVPAVDRLIELGVADPKNIGLFGHSAGGYTVYALLTQTDRFAAAAALSAPSDLTTDYGAFEATSRGLAGLEQDMSVNPLIYELGYGFGTSPSVDPGLYQRSSPLHFAGSINTPLLIIHGELDIRIGAYQAEAMFTLLNRHGKQVRLNRYWGESHSLANSPANVRDIYRELNDWFDRNLKYGGDAGGTVER